MPKAADPLATYNKKRDFAKTAEPSGKRGAKRGKDLIFMVQKHDASRLHYDLRLELEGTLKSWAVTRGPSLDPADKRLAVRTEDHPMSYATFEGTIPKGEYGGGTVMLWDRGVWLPHPDKDPVKTLEEGHLHFTLEGERMKGEWIMIRMKPRGKERGENWLLRKIEDEYAGSPTGLTEMFLTSVKTGRTMDEIATGKKVAEPPSSPPRKRDSRFRGNDEKRSALPKFRAPQKATLVDAVPTGTGWLHEMKYDGYRCLLAVAGGKAKIYTRTGLDWTDKFPEIAEAAAGLQCDSALLDGEIVALDETGNTGFSALQQAISDGGRGLSLFLFDALEIDARRSTNAQSRTQQRPRLLGDGLPPFILMPNISSKASACSRRCAGGRKGSLEEGRRALSPHAPRLAEGQVHAAAGIRDPGWSESDKKGRGFRALLLGLNEEGKLRYAGKVGTGFSMAVQAELRATLDTLAADKAAAVVPRAEARGAHWVKPKLVAEVAFAEFTAENVVRHASFLGLRSDKKAKDVVPEKPQPLPPTAVAEDDVKISNPDRIIFPESDVTKGELAAYYRALGAPMAEWTANRPISLVRCPQGRGKKCFFQKHDSGTFGAHVLHVPIREKDGHDEDYLYVDGPAGVLACTQMGTIEFHGWGSKVADVEKADRIVFDLDPDEGLDFAKVKSAAHDLKRHLADMGLVTFPMLTGGKGVQSWCRSPRKPNGGGEGFAKRSRWRWPRRAGALHRRSRQVKRKGRSSRYLRNQRGATAVMPYSARAREGAPVAAPIGWEELDEMKSGARFSVRDAELLLERAASRTLQGWGEANQVLPGV